MTITIRWDEALARLDRYRAVLLGLVADQLTYSIPLVAVPLTATDLVHEHQRQLYEAVENLHDTLQAARVSELLLVHEFEWAGRVLPRWGITAEHAELMIESYVSTAQKLGSWEPAEQQVLEELRAYLRHLARSAFPPDRDRTV